MQLVHVFTCRISKEVFRLALVQSLDRRVPRGLKGATDKALSIQRWSMHPQNRCEVIPLDCIVHGAVLVKDPKPNGDYLVIDALDNDMFLRVLKI